MATEQDIMQIVAMIGAAYPNFAPTKETVEVYYQVLNDIPTDLLRAATMECISVAGRKFAPSVGEIRGAVGDIRRSVTGVPSSYQAWEEVQRQILENGGDFGHPSWSHPVVAEAVRAIGWRNLRMSENQAADRARFIEAYDQLASRRDHDEMMLPQVRGYIEANGRQLPAPAFEMKRLADKMRR